MTKGVENESKSLVSGISILIRYLYINTAITTVCLYGVILYCTVLIAVTVTLASGCDILALGNLYYIICMIWYRFTLCYGA